MTIYTIEHAAAIIATLPPPPSALDRTALLEKTISEVRRCCRVERVEYSICDCKERLVDLLLSAASEAQVVRACARGDEQRLRTLLKRGADPNERDEDGSTAMMQACSHNQIECVRLLLERNADVNAATMRTGETALMRACSVHELPMIRLLCAYGASREATDTEGSTPEDYARGQTAWREYSERQIGVLAWLSRTVQFQSLHLIEELTKEKAAALLRSRADVHALTSRTTAPGNGWAGPLADRFTPLGRAREVVREWKGGMPAPGLRRSDHVRRATEPFEDPLSQRGFEAAQLLCRLADSPWTASWLCQHSSELSWWRR